MNAGSAENDDAALIVERRFNNWVFAIAAIGGLGATVLFFAWPQLDILVAGYFYDPEHGFSFNQLHSATVARQVLIYLFTGSVIWCMYGFMNGLADGQPALSLEFRRWVFLASSLIIGPGILANLVFKAPWGRARPRDVVEFGGNLEFSSPLLITDQCSTNCSFVSGESSSIFMLFFAVGLAYFAHRWLWFATAFCLGSVAGLLRIGVGGHFLSDVVFSAVAMALVAALLHRLIVLQPIGQPTGDSPIARAGCKFVCGADHVAGRIADLVLKLLDRLAPRRH